MVDRAGSAHSPRTTLVVTPASHRSAWPLRVKCFERSRPVRASVAGPPLAVRVLLDAGHNSPQKADGAQCPRRSRRRVSRQKPPRQRQCAPPTPPHSTAGGPRPCRTTRDSRPQGTAAATERAGRGPARRHRSRRARASRRALSAPIPSRGRCPRPLADHRARRGPPERSGRSTVVPQHRSDLPAPRPRDPARARPATPPAHTTDEAHEQSLTWREPRCSICAVSSALDHRSVVLASRSCR